MQRQSLSLHWALVLLMYAFVAGLLAGCAAPQTPLQRVVLAKHTVALTANALNQAIDAGKVSEADKRVIHNLAQAVDLSIAMMEQAAVKGDETAYRTALGRFNDAMDALIAKRIEAERNP